MLMNVHRCAVALATIVLGLSGCSAEDGEDAPALQGAPEAEMPTRPA